MIMGDKIFYNRIVLNIIAANII